jgi:hypothetical protein
VEGLSFLKIIGVIIAAIGGILPNYFKTTKESGKHKNLTRPGRILIGIVCLGVLLTIVTEIIDQQMRARKETLREQWDQMSHQVVSEFRYGILLKKNIDAFELLADKSFVAIQANSPLEERNYISPPRTSFALFSWTSHPDSIWSAEFSVLPGKPIKGRDVLLIPFGESYQPSQEVRSETITSYLTILPNLTQDTSTSLRLWDGMIFRVNKKIGLNPLEDKTGGIVGRSEWSPFGLKEYIATMEDLSRIRKIVFIMSKSIALELKAVILSFIAVNGKELYVFLPDLKFYDLLEENNKETGYVRSEIEGIELFKKLKNQFFEKGNTELFEGKQ